MIVIVREFTSLAGEYRLGVTWIVDGRRFGFWVRALVV